MMINRSVHSHVRRPDGKEYGSYAMKIRKKILGNEHDDTLYGMAMTFILRQLVKMWGDPMRTQFPS